MLLASTLAWVLFTVLPRSVATNDSRGPIRLLDLQDHLVDPFDVTPGTRAIVLVFVSADCPISNRYAPEVRRLHDRFSPQGVRFWLVYSSGLDSRDTIRAHVKGFGYPMGALRDPQLLLARIAKATVTPEVAVFLPPRRLVYHGRIDDRYVDFAVDRQTPTRRDLQDALIGALSGKRVPSTSPAIGCSLF